MSDGLVAFLRDCLDEDQAGALAAATMPGGYNDRTGAPGPAGRDGRTWQARDAAYYEDPYWSITTTPPGTEETIELVGSGAEGGGVHMAEVAAHIARHDPARVLAEVEAKRAIVDHAEYWFTTLRQTPEGWTVETCTAYRMAMEWTLRRLAAPYADRPGYQQEWRP